MHICYTLINMYGICSEILNGKSLCQKLWFSAFTFKTYTASTTVILTMIQISICSSIMKVLWNIFYYWQFAIRLWSKSLGGLLESVKYDLSVTAAVIYDHPLPWDQFMGLSCHCSQYLMFSSPLSAISHLKGIHPSLIHCIINNDAQILKHTPHIGSQSTEYFPLQPSSCQSCSDIHITYCYSELRQHS